MMDTSPVAQAIQSKIQRNMTGAERLLLAIEISLATRELSLARLRRQHPEWSETELRRELLRYSFAANDLPSPLR